MSHDPRPLADYFKTDGGDYEERFKRFQHSELFADLAAGRRRVRVDYGEAGWSQKKTMILPPEFWNLANYRFLNDADIGLCIWHMDDGRGSGYYIKPIVLGVEPGQNPLQARKKLSAGEKMKQVLPEILKERRFTTRVAIHKAVLVKLRIVGDEPRGYTYNNFLKQCGPQLDEFERI